MAFYVYCDDDSRHKSLTEEQILSLIAQAQAGMPVIDPNAGVLTKVKETNNGDYITFWVGTQAQYNALNGNTVKNCLYIITDETTEQDIEKTLSGVNTRMDNISNSISALSQQSGCISITKQDIIKEQGGELMSIATESVMWFEYFKAISMVHFRAHLFLDGSMSKGEQVCIKLPSGAFYRHPEQGGNVLSCWSQQSGHGSFIAYINPENRIILRAVDGFSTGATVTVEGWYPCVGEVVK